MKNKYILVLGRNGDIQIIEEYENNGGFKEIYHKTYNPSETIKDNLIDAYEEWERLTKENDNDIS